MTISKSSFLGYVFTILDSSCAGTKNHLFTHNNDDFSTISVTEQNYAMPISKVECHIPDSQQILCQTFGEGEEWNLVHQAFSVNCSSIMFIMYK